MKFLLKILPVFIIFLISCAPWKEISPEQAYKMLKNNNYTLIDMSKSLKYRDSHILNAISIEFHPKTFKKEISLVDRTKPIIVYCGTGKKTEKAKYVMEKLNFINFYIISGGLKAWEAEKLPLVK
jgi:rhodanese-related sulfurtransferase